jgi:hypothetical protein
VSLRAWAEEAEAAAGIARSLAPTAFVPDQLKVWENPEERNPAKKVLAFDATVATVAAVLLAGQELGLKPMASLRSFTIIRGTVAMYAVAARALLLQAGHEIVIKETTSQRAIVHARRAGAEQWQEAKWDLERARTAKLYPGHPDGQWSRQPQPMLVARATAEASRWVAADALLGLPLMVEEIEDSPDGVAPPLAIEAGPAAASPAAEEPKAKTTRKRAAVARAPLPAGPPAQPAAPIPPEPASPSPKANKAQRTRLHAALKGIGVTDRDEALGMISAWISPPDGPPRVLTSTTDLTTAELSAAIERLEAIKTIARAEPPEEGPPPDAEPD